MAVAAARYGKANVRLLKVKRDPNDRQNQDVIELRVRCLLEGAIETSYTDADNSVVVPTDTVKNTLYILAKQGEVWPIELFAARAADHFISRYSHITGVHVDIQQLCWNRYDVNGKPHAHSFVLAKDEFRTCKLYKQRGDSYKIRSGIQGLTVLKSTGSMFYDYNMCEYTTLQPTWDRFLSTDIDATWDWDTKIIPDLAAVERQAKEGLFDRAYTSARSVTLEIFALENSASVQATMYNMGMAILAKFPEIKTVNYGLPNKHYMEIDLSWHKGLQNKGKDAEVLLPSSDPNGYIECSVKRDSDKAKF